MKPLPLPDRKPQPLEIDSGCVLFTVLLAIFCLAVLFILSAMIPPPSNDEESEQRAIDSDHPTKTVPPNS